jgi:DNA-directed RNA polymerase subunit alpha
MAIRINRFEMPKSVAKDEATATPTFARYFVEPFEVGYGRTIGNSLRRVLLSSIEGTAVTSVRIAGAQHEFCCVPGIVEDVTDIVLNLKKVLFKSYTRNACELRINVKGPGTVTAADIETDGRIVIVNPECHIATLSDDGRLDAQIELGVGRGFMLGKRDGARTAEDETVDRIPVDAKFSPVSRVNFFTENKRVGQRVDYDKLTIEIWTDGRIGPDEALTTAAAILRRHMDVFVNYDENIVEFDETEKLEDAHKEDLRKKLDMSVNEIELSVRAANCLNNANITTVGQLCRRSEPDMLKYRNFGKKSLNEIKQKLESLGLSLGMGMGADQDDVETDE